MSRKNRDRYVPSLESCSACRAELATHTAPKPAGHAYGPPPPPERLCKACWAKTKAPSLDRRRRLHVDPAKKGAERSVVITNPSKFLATIGLLGAMASRPDDFRER